MFPSKGSLNLCEILLLLPAMLPYNFITVDGNTGAGKTTLAEMLAEEFGGKLILEEFVANPFLKRFYADRDRWAFHTELSFLIDRYHQLQETIEQLDLYGSLHIADYIFRKSLLYAKVNLDDEEFALFERVFNMVIQDLPDPEMTIYIHSTSERLVKNIEKRGRDFEQGVDKGYLDAVERVYFDHFRSNQHLRILVIDGDHLDFVGNNGDYKKIVNAISQEYDTGITQLHL